MTPKGHEHWIKELQKYDRFKDRDDRECIICALSYTLQSLRNGEDIDRFKWG